MRDIFVILLIIILLPIAIFIVSFVYNLTIKTMRISKAARPLTSRSRLDGNSPPSLGLTSPEVKKIAELYVAYLLTEFLLWQVSLVPEKSDQETLDEAEMKANSEWIALQKYLIDLDFDRQKKRYEISSQISQNIFDQSELDFLFVYQSVPKETDSEESVVSNFVEMNRRRAMPTEQFIIECLVDMTSEIYSATKSERRRKIPAQAFRLRDL